MIFCRSAQTFCESLSAVCLFKTISQLRDVLGRQAAFFLSFSILRRINPNCQILRKIDFEFTMSHPDSVHTGSERTVCVQWRYSESGRCQGNSGAVHLFVGQQIQSAGQGHAAEAETGGHQHDRNFSRFGIYGRLVRYCPKQKILAVSRSEILQGFFCCSYFAGAVLPSMRFRIKLCTCSGRMFRTTPNS